MRRYFTCAIYSSYPGSSARSVRSSCTARNAIPTTMISANNNPYHDPGKRVVPTMKMIPVAYIGWRTYHLKPARHWRPTETNRIERHQNQPSQKVHVCNYVKHFIPGLLIWFTYSHHALCQQSGVVPEQPSA